MESADQAYWRILAERLQVRLLTMEVYTRPESGCRDAQPVVVVDLIPLDFSCYWFSGFISWLWALWRKWGGKLKMPGNSAGDLFGMVSSRDPNSKVVGELQLGDKKVHGLNHLVVYHFLWFFCKFVSTKQVVSTPVLVLGLLRLPMTHVCVSIANQRDPKDQCDWYIYTYICMNGWFLWLIKWYR